MKFFSSLFSGRRNINNNASTSGQNRKLLSNNALGMDLYSLGFENEIVRNNVWYRGEGSELQAFYEQTNDYVGNNSFWKARASSGITFRKIHSGLPALIVDTLADIVCCDYLGASTGGDIPNGIWNEIAEENKFEELMKKALKEVLVNGDGAFKISLDTSVSKFPIIEFVSADRIDYHYKRGRLESVVFKTNIVCDGKQKKTFLLKEIYSFGSVSYRLYDCDGNEIPLDSIEQTACYTGADVVLPDKIMMAIPLKIDDSSKWAGRGKSIFEGKFDAFDGLDEILSQWIDALRDGRAKTYIPSFLLPRNPSNGLVMKPNSFDNRYIQTDSDMRESSSNTISVVQAEINTAAYLDSYITFLDLCLQGIIAPSTLGIDVKKLDNAEAQREKEKATLYSRNKLIFALQNTIPDLVCAALKVYAASVCGNLDDVETLKKVSKKDIKISFGEYANPSFEAQVETIGKAYQMGIMSEESVVEELYGNTWSDERKKKEIELLKNGRGTKNG